ncbi:EAL domain-containing protein [Metabacillus sp. RGM 3146]|uniref:EAL domain-containing protein n=1 Tax=Metabacillus sp. RGM 3146 TaxID=3401092 RepID=UPI003B9DAD92
MIPHYVDGCPNDSTKQIFIYKVVALAKNLEITVLAEGIETKEEYEYLRSAGITLAQGYYIGKPGYSPAVFASA